MGKEGKTSSPQTSDQFPVHISLFLRVKLWSWHQIWHPSDCNFRFAVAQLWLTMKVRELIGQQEMCCVSKWLAVFMAAQQWDDLPGISRRRNRDVFRRSPILTIKKHICGSINTQKGHICHIFVEGMNPQLLWNTGFAPDPLKYTRWWLKMAKGNSPVATGSASSSPEWYPSAQNLGICSKMIKIERKH